MKKQSPKKSVPIKQTLGFPKSLYALYEIFIERMECERANTRMDQGVWQDFLGEMIYDMQCRARDAYYLKRERNG